MQKNIYSAAVRVRFHRQLENRNMSISTKFVPVSPTEKERKHTFVRVQVAYVSIVSKYGVDWS